MQNPSFLRRLTGDSGSLRARSIRASAITAGGIFAQRGLSLVSNLIMTRLLVPEAFGLMAMVVVVHILVTMLSDIGIHQSIIRSERGDQLHFLRAAWSVQIVRSTLITAAVVTAGLGVGVLGPRLAAPDSVYADPQLPWLIVVSALAMLFKGFESTGIALAKRRLMLGKITQIEIGNQIIVIILMVLLAQWQATVWVLLLGMMLGALQRMIWTHIAFRDTPMGWVWDREIAADLWQFGRWLIVSSLSTFVVNQGDRLILGAFLDKTTFGIYVIAALWIDAGANLISMVGSQIALAGFAEKLRTARDQFALVFRKVMRVFAVLVVATFLGGFFIGPLLIKVLYTPEYHAAGWMVALLSFRFLCARTTPYAMFLLAEGQSRTVAFVSIVSAAIMMLGLPLVLTQFGVTAAITMIALAPIWATPLLVMQARRRMPDLPPFGLELALIAATVAVAILVAVTGLYGG
ncbi:MAG: oligosaccharide flippase family protein [Paracoccus sp. (in: a-proteobacteria)]|uniref:oligosaccharide flippase family protein n=1 Tax=Paracoccus sp. TaxID=267 RepID=UPI0026DF534F|nr:oligosaccharide flippase family protein [Paracoccus sp. (in: a-proteobacteria)]MDO5612146.1 oligosaccharide flippase family protein [Paracoccus sp. (in: a-proteobacteria)]